MGQGTPQEERLAKARRRTAQLLGRAALAAPEAGQMWVSRSGLPSHCVSGQPWGDGAEEGLGSGCGGRTVITDPGQQGGKQGVSLQDEWELRSTE